MLKPSVIVGLFVLLVFYQFCRIGGQKILDDGKMPEAPPNAQKLNRLENIDVEKLVSFALKPRSDEEVKAGNPVYSFSLMNYGNNLITSDVIIFKPKEKKVTEINYYLNETDEQTDRSIRVIDTNDTNDLTFDISQFDENFFRKIFTTVKTQYAKSFAARSFSLEIKKNSSGDLQISVIIGSDDDPQFLRFNEKGDFVSGIGVK